MGRKEKDRAVSERGGERAIETTNHSFGGDGDTSLVEVRRGEGDSRMARCSSRGSSRLTAGSRRLDFKVVDSESCHGRRMPSRVKFDPGRESATLRTQCLTRSAESKRGLRPKCGSSAIPTRHQSNPRLFSA